MNEEEIKKELERFPVLHDKSISNFESLAYILGTIIGQEMYKKMSEEDIKKLLDYFQKEKEKKDG